MIAVREGADSGATIIVPQAKLTLANAQEFLKAVHAIPTAMAPNVIVDLEQTHFVDSSGVGALVNAMKHIQAMNGTFALVGLRPAILRSFRLMNLHQVFDIYETEALARQLIRERRL
jgi:anti-sigma B factor antagonist